MYRITVYSENGEEADSFCHIIPLTPALECGILNKYPEGHYLDIARIAIDIGSDTFAFGNIDISQEDYE